MKPDACHLLVVIPTYNERSNLPDLVCGIFAAIPDCHLLVVDDASPDGTGDWCAEMGRGDERVHLLARQGKKGIGSALLAGMRYAVENDYRLLVTMDADFSHPPAELPRLVAAVDEAGSVDVAIASRYTQGGGVEGWPLRRRMMSGAVNFVARWLLGLRVRDCSTGFRGYRTAALRRLVETDCFSSGYAFEEEVLFCLQRQGATFSEIPTWFVNRGRGGSKLNGSEAVRAAGALLRLALSRFWPCSTC